MFSTVITDHLQELNADLLCAPDPGESIQVTVCSCEEDTAALLATVLDGHQAAADLLAQAIHQDLQLMDEAAESLELLLCPSEVAIWIDPIGNINIPLFLISKI